MGIFHAISSPKVLRTVLWLFGTYVSSLNEVVEVVALLKKALEPFPLTPPAATTASSVGSVPEQIAPAMQVVTSVREDGTYATSYVPVSAASLGACNECVETTSRLRSLITEGKYFVASALAVALSQARHPFVLQP
ncbi:hypothetical protein ERJ75_001776900 [Trypanosoma vivax]|nr:hypothetical protein ERJ75_001776900 [Trypanosoma vivax]